MVPGVMPMAIDLYVPLFTITNGETAMSKGSVGNLLTTKEAAARMRVSTDWLVRQAMSGEIASIKIGSAVGICGGRRLFPESEIEGWLERNLTGGKVNE